MPVDLDRLRGLLQWASPGPWEASSVEHRDIDGAPFDVPCVLRLPTGAPDDDGDMIAPPGMTDADATLIAESRNALPSLLAEIVALRLVAGAASSLLHDAERTLGHPQVTGKGGQHAGAPRMQASTAILIRRELGAALAAWQKTKEGP